MGVTDRCIAVESQLIDYLDGRAKPAERRSVEEHMAGCAKCRTRAEEFRMLWSALDDLPAAAISPSFDASLRARLTAEPVGLRFWSWLPAPRLAFATVVLVALSVWISFLPRMTRNPSEAIRPTTAQADFRMIRDLSELENYDVISQFDALSELPISQTSIDAENVNKVNRE